MVQNVFAKYQPWMCVVKGCRVHLKDHAHGGLLGKGWKLATTHAGVAKAMDLPCKCTQKHVPCQGKLTRQSAYYTEDFARRVTRALLHQFDVRSLFHEVRGEQAPPKFLVGCSRECNCNMVNHPRVVCSVMFVKWVWKKENHLVSWEKGMKWKFLSSCPKEKRLCVSKRSHSYTETRATVPWNILSRP